MTWQSAWLLSNAQPVFPSNPDPPAPQKPGARPGSPHSKQKTPSPPANQPDSAGHRAQSSTLVPFQEDSTSPETQTPASTGTPKTTRTARFTPQQAEDSLATRKSTTSILRLSRRYRLIPFWKKQSNQLNPCPVPQSCEKQPTRRSRIPPSHTGRDPVIRMSTSRRALACHPGPDATCETPTSARNRSKGSRSLRMSPFLIARFTSASIAP